jgi:hypothetical protein
MSKIQKIQVCFKCKERRLSIEFYEKGNRFINCVKCRSGRMKKRKETQMLLKKDKELNSHRVV